MSLANQIGDDRPDGVGAPAIASQPAIDMVATPARLSRSVAFVGGILSGVAMAAAVSIAAGSASDQALQVVPTGELDVAAQSLVIRSAASLVEDAKACRRPLGVLTFVATGSAKGRIRFISGGYVSPFVRLSGRAERMALPFPAAPEAGRGQITIEGENDGVDVFLRPGFHVPAGRSSQVLNVRWDPKTICR